MDNTNFLDHYFVSIYNKLEADALLFNRELPHAGLMGSENELALSNLLRDFLPPQIGIETSGIVIDRHGKTSKQCDIILYDAFKFPKYLRKIFPVEVVYGIIEVKTSMTSQEAKIALENLKSLNMLDYYPALTPYWQTKTKEKNLFHTPPFGIIFAYRSQAKSFETFAKWFPWDYLHKGVSLKNSGDQIRVMTVSSLDQGIIKMESSNGYVQRWAMPADKEAIESKRSFETKIANNDIDIDPAKVLFIFLETLWQNISNSEIHPGFDIRSYISSRMNIIIPVEEI